MRFFKRREKHPVVRAAEAVLQDMMNIRRHTMIHVHDQWSNGESRMIAGIVGNCQHLVKITYGATTDLMPETVTAPLKKSLELLDHILWRLNPEKLPLDISANMIIDVFVVSVIQQMQDVIAAVEEETR